MLQNKKQQRAKLEDTIIIDHCLMKFLTAKTGGNVD